MPYTFVSGRDAAALTLSPASGQLCNSTHAQLQLMQQDDAIHLQEQATHTVPAVAAAAADPMTAADQAVLCQCPASCSNAYNISMPFASAWQSLQSCICVQEGRVDPSTDLCCRPTHRHRCIEQQHNEYCTTAHASTGGVTETTLGRPRLRGGLDTIHSRAGASPNYSMRCWPTCLVVIVVDTLLTRYSTAGVVCIQQM